MRLTCDRSTVIWVTLEKREVSHQEFFSSAGTAKKRCFRKKHGYGQDSAVESSNMNSEFLHLTLKQQQQSSCTTMRSCWWMWGTQFTCDQWSLSENNKSGMKCFFIERRARNNRRLFSMEKMSSLFSWQFNLPTSSAGSFLLIHMCFMIWPIEVIDNNRRIIHPITCLVFLKVT